MSELGRAALVVASFESKLSTVKRHEEGEEKEEEEEDDDEEEVKYKKI